MIRETMRRWGPALLVMLGIFVGSAIPGEEFPVYRGGWDFVVKKSGHLLEYGLLAATLLRGVAGAHAPTRRQYAAALGLAALYAASDEFHQRFTPGREARLTDVAIDILGAGLGLVLLHGWRVTRKTRSQNPQSRSTRPRA